MYNGYTYSKDDAKFLTLMNIVTRNASDEDKIHALLLTAEAWDEMTEASEIVEWLGGEFASPNWREEAEAEMREADGLAETYADALGVGLQ
jgi:hypothetical protein